MAWTSPRTWQTGQLVTASNLNTDLRDNLNYLYNRTNLDTAVTTATLNTVNLTLIQAGTLSVSLTTIGKPVLLIADFLSAYINSVGHTGYFRWYNATNAANVGEEHEYNATLRIPLNVSVIDSPAAGTYTWYMRWRIDAAPGQFNTLGLRLWAVELL